MKRKALVILTVAILAFAMIPALGTQAAEGEVKIVTPDELANPDGDSGPSFDRLEETEFVSTQTGTSADLEDASGTLFIVVEDNDAQSNTLKNLVATYTGYNRGGDNADTFSIKGIDTILAGTTFPSTVMDTSVPPVPSDSAELVIADRNRDGNVTSADVTLKINGATYESVVVAVDAEMGTLRVSTSTFPQGDVTIDFATSTTDALVNSTTGVSLLEVRSTSGEAINPIASEKSLPAYRNMGLTSGGINSVGFNSDAAVSKDSGIFVAMIGLIDNDWKLMLSEWISDDSDQDDTDIPLKDGEATYQLILTEAEGLPVRTGEEEALSITVPVNLTGENGTNAPGGGNYLYDTNGDAVINKLDVTASFVAGVNSSSRVAATVTDVSVDATNGQATVSVRLTGVADQTVATGVLATGDTVVVGYQVTGSISDMIDAVTQAGSDPAGTQDATHGAFDDLCRSPNPADMCPEAKNLTDAIEAHQINLGLSLTNTGASILVNSIVGVSDGDNLEVRYLDPTPGEGTQRTSATVDTVAPTISGFDPSHDSFTTDDRFDAVFTVTDAGSGIFEDAEEIVILRSTNHVEATFVTRRPGGSESVEMPLVTKEEEDVNDGFLYEVEFDVRDRAQDAEEDNQNLEVLLTVVAYDKARNKATEDVTYTVDVIDPELLGAITGWGVGFSSDADRNDETSGAYILQEGQLDAIALVFNGPVDGNAVRANSIAIAGHTVSSITWLDNEGANVLSIGSGRSEDAGKATDIDFNAKTRAGNQANGYIEDGEGAGLDLSLDVLGQDARHVLFAQIDGEFDTDSRPSIEIDGEDLSDLAGNENGDDHSLARSRDGIPPKFTVNVVNKLSNDTLDLAIEASEALERSPSAEITLTGSALRRPLDVDAASGGTNWVVNDDRESLGLTGKDGIQDGVWKIEVTGTDENDNTATVSTATWELDTQANGGEDPTPDGKNAAGKVAIETANVIFLSLNFNDESNEYAEGADNVARGKDSATSTAIDALALETLDADGEVTATKDLNLSIAQTSDGKRFVIALAEDDEGNAVAPIGSYQLAIDYSDTAGNSDDYDFKFAIIAQVAEKIKVSPGWSLISIPGRPQSVNIDDVLNKSKVTDVWSLNNETNLWEFAQLDKESGTFMGNLTQIVDGRSYFVRSTTFDPIEVLLQRFNPQRTPPQYPVATGWNSVGYTPAGEEREVSVDGYLSSLGTSGWGMIRMWNANATPPRYETYYSSGVSTDGFPKDSDGVAEVRAGTGYLLFATRNGVIGG